MEDTKMIESIKAALKGCESKKAGEFSTGDLCWIMEFRERVKFEADKMTLDDLNAINKMLASARPPKTNQECPQSGPILKHAKVFVDRKYCGDLDYYVNITSEFKRLTSLLIDHIEAQDKYIASYKK